ncbi:MAG TPA: LysR family transcriptional regulator [Hyphomicrobiaceae bacterium]|jgi:DNA-binding transcriptional LysR family regulator|nr:LysR family transcriptional regulator [Hyphomicrobiaceae bacterium]
MDRIDLFRIFVRVAECASFTQAAQTLGLPRSSVSTAVQDLETRMGARLLNRTTRRVSLTHDGTAFYDRCLRLLADIEETEGLFRKSSEHLGGRLRVDVPGRIGRLIIAPELPDFLSRFPAIKIELGVTDRAVNLVEDNVDCAIRVGALGDSTLIARRISDLKLINCASPAYLQAHGVPRTPDDLDRHHAVLYASPSTGRAEDWEWCDKGELHTRPMHANVTVNGAEAYIACALAGLGLIQIPAYDVRDYLASGALVEVMPEHRAPPLPMTLLYPHRRHLSRRLQIFIEWVVPLLQQRVA